MKSYTDLEQSKKLAEILPIESADAFYPWRELMKDYDSIYVPEKMLMSDIEEDDILAWSLAALLSVLEHPRCFQGDKPTYWFCGCFGKDKLYHEVEADSPVNACVAMIIKLHKLDLL